MPVRRLSYVPALDGLRAVAVLLVLIFHCGVPGFQGGWIGVDIFFVLSGFLITRILSDEWRTTGDISILRFYLRRTFRLVPALWTMLLLTNAFLVLARAPSAFSHALAADAVASFFYVINWTGAFQVGDRTLYGHAWSLSVEEQFYIFWAMIFPPLLRWRGTLGAAQALMIMLVASTLCRLVLAWYGYESTIKMNRIGAGFEACLFGCMAALYHLQASVRRRLTSIFLKCRYLGSGALAILLGSALTEMPVNPYCNIILQLTKYAASAVIIIEVIAMQSLANRVLASPPLVRIGVISYGVYLWHYPLIASAHFFPNFTPQSALGMAAFVGAVALVLATLSYHCIERPFLKLKAKIGHPEAGISRSIARRAEHRLHRADEGW